MENPARMIDTLHQIHLDNSRQLYLVKQRRGPSRAIMPATPFIFEFFLYNSIYQVDWENTETNGHKTEFPVGLDENGRSIRLSEGKQQKALEKYLRKKCQHDTTLLQRAFAPLGQLPDLDAPWTRIRTEDPAKTEEGERFFKRITELRNLVNSGELLPTGSIFDLIGECRYFVYNVRNNIFHGSKSLADLYDDNQGRRIEVYHLFLQSLVSLFFLTSGRKPVAADHVQSQVAIPTLSGESRIIPASGILELVVNNLIKPEDSRLIAWARRWLSDKTVEQGPDGALFYPSAGYDVITPVIIGLPYCTDFYFYDKGETLEQGLPTRRPGQVFFQHKKALERLAKILGVPDRPTDEGLSFEFDGVVRRIHLVQANNSDFLKHPGRLRFLFRRGDSSGEGGSDQRWDNGLFEQWRAMIPQGKSCCVLTDGEPGGVCPELLTYMETKGFPNADRKRPYHLGMIPSI